MRSENVRSFRSCLLALMLLVAGFAATAQSLKKYPIEKTGCSVYMFCDPGKFELSMSPDSSKVYVAECTHENVYYDVICVRMKEFISKADEAEGVLVQYLDYLKSSFGIASAMGYGKGHRLRGNEQTRGIIDYWKDDKGNNIKVKGWTNGRFIAVAIVISEKEIPEPKVNAFLDGFVFPDEKKK
jgi:hypothetical protein